MTFHAKKLNYQEKRKSKEKILCKKELKVVPTYSFKTSKEKYGPSQATKNVLTDLKEYEACLLESGEVAPSNVSERKSKKFSEAFHASSSDASPSPSTVEQKLKCNNMRSSKSSGSPNRSAVNNGKTCGEQPFNCDACGKAFAKTSSLAAHKRSHNEKKAYQCDICSKSFVCMDHLALHKHIHKETPQQHHCDICGKAFNQNSTLMAHKRTHSREKTDRCDTRSRSFRRRDSLNLRQRVRSGEQSFKGDLCETAGNHNSRLVGVHKRKRSREKPNCYDNNLEAHKRKSSKEKAYQCLVCSKSLPRKDASTLRKHAHCVCGKTFIQNCNLVAHKRIHSIKRPYQCIVCGKVFTQHASFLRHVQLHEEDEVIIKTPKHKLTAHDFSHCKLKPFQLNRKNCFNGLACTENREKVSQSGEAGKTFGKSYNLTQNKRKYDGKDKSGEKIGKCVKVRCTRNPYDFRWNDGSATSSLMSFYNGPEISAYSFSRFLPMKSSTLASDLLKCKVCFKVSKNLGAAILHKRMHHARKSYVCDECGRAFDWRYLLRKHELLHNMELRPC